MSGTSRQSWRTWALVASLGLNLVFAGLVAGAFWRGPPAPALPGVGQYMRALPEPYRRDLGHAFREGRPDLRGMRDAVRGRRAALAAALTAEPFDPAAVAALLADERRVTGELATRGGELLLAQVERMTPAERADYAAALLDDSRRHGGGRRP